MKALILSLIVTVLTTTASIASVTPTPKSELSIINSERVELAVVNVAQKDFFEVAQYNANMDALDFVTKDYVTYIQIFNAAGKLQYQLPVMSNKLKISRKMFDQGNYKLAFITKNNTTIQFTDLKVN